MARKSKPPAKKAAPRRAATKRGKGKFGAKAAFVRAHPDLTASQVVELAAKAGLTLTANHVYNVRSTSGISRRREPAAVADAIPVRPLTIAPVKVLTAAKAARVASDAEAQFRRLVLDLGVARARALVHDVESKLAALLSGR